MGRRLLTSYLLYCFAFMLLVHSQRMTAYYILLLSATIYPALGYINYIDLHWTMHNAGYEMRVTYYRGQTDMKARV